MGAQNAVIALSFDTVRDVALVVVAVAAVLAVVAMLVVKWIVGKLIVLGLLIGLAAVVWWQRDSLEGCADGVRETMAAGSTDTTTCSFFGRDVTVDSPRG